MQLKHVPNAITVLRLAMIPVLWAVALLAPDGKAVFAGLLAVTFLTDTLDGYLCRRYGLSTELGAKLDRIADELLALNTTVWLYVLRPELYRTYWVPLVALLGLFTLSVGLQLVRYRRRVPFHLYSGKLMNWVIGLFAVYTFVFGATGGVVWAAVALVAYALLEEIALVCTRRELDEHVTSIFARSPGGAGDE